MTSRLLLTVAFVASIALGSWMWSSMSRYRAAGPHLAAASVMHLGSVESGDVLRGALPILNDGTEPLVISSVYGECGCTTVSVPKMALGVAERGVVNISFDSHGYAGDVTKEITLLSNDAEAQMKVLPFHVHVTFQQVLDRQTVDLGSTPFGALGQPQFITALRDPKRSSPIEAIVLDGLPPDVQYVVDPEWRQDGTSQTRRVRLQLVPARTPRSYDETVTMRVGDAVFPVRLHYVIAPVLRARPLVGFLQLAKRDHIQIELQGPKVDDLRVSSRSGFVIGQLTDQGKGLLVRLSDGAAPSSHDYDVVDVSYRVSGSDRRESMEVPIRIVQ